MCTEVIEFPCGKFQLRPCLQQSSLYFPFLISSAEKTSIAVACLHMCCQKNLKEKHDSERRREGKKQGPVLSKLSWRCSVTQFSALFRRGQRRTNRRSIDAASVWKERSGGWCVRDPVSDRCCAASSGRRGRKEMLFLC